MVKLQPIDLQNVNIHYKWNNDEEINFYDSDYPHLNESFESFLTRLKTVADIHNPASDLLEILDEESGKVIGVIDIHNIDPFNKKCDIECTIGNKSYRKKGYGKAAMQLTLAYCFEKLGMEKVSTFGFEFNQSWLTLLNKLGFVREGELRNHALKNGKYCNKYVFSLLKAEYENVSQDWITNNEAILA